jgi:hypothetical protein
MKTVVLIVLALLHATNSLGAAASKDEIIRKPGHYSLDNQGSELTIAKDATGLWSLTASWHSGDAASSSTSSTYQSLPGAAWFVLVENPNRIWIFDGVDQGILLTHSEKESGSKAFPAAALRRSPPKFWDALPQELRAKYLKSQPGRPDGGKGDKQAAPK